MSKPLRVFKAEIFQALGHPTRVAIIEQLCMGESSVNELCEKIKLKQVTASQHLAVLRSKRIVVTRKVGNQIIYRLGTTVLADVLEKMRDYFYTQLTESTSLLRSVQLEQAKEATESAMKLSQKANSRTAGTKEPKNKVGAVKPSRSVSGESKRNKKCLSVDLFIPVSQLMMAGEFFFSMN